MLVVNDASWLHVLQSSKMAYTATTGLQTCVSLIVHVPQCPSVETT
jgi:hypothetical protein